MATSAMPRPGKTSTSRASPGRRAPGCRDARRIGAGSIWSRAARFAGAAWESANGKLELQFVLYLSEGFQGGRKVLLGMGGRNLRADAGFPLGHDRVGKANDVNALGEHGVGELRGERGVANHYGHDRMCAGQDVKAALGDFLAKEFRVGLELVAQGGGFGEQFQDLDRRAGDARGQGVGE